MDPRLQIYQFKVEALNGAWIDFSKYKGKYILIVNVASECGNTPQYQQLEELYQECSNKLMVIGCPCNDFGGQEPGSSHQIEIFCKRNYGVSFPLTKKMNIVSPPVDPLYQWLTQQSENGVMDSNVTWNFQKYILDTHGKLVSVFSPETEPLDDRILSIITT